MALLEENDAAQQLGGHDGAPGVGAEGDRDLAEDWAGAGGPITWPLEDESRSTTDSIFLGVLRGPQEGTETAPRRLQEGLKGTPK